jgi:hypothetical protein
MNFIINLLESEGYDQLWVIVDRFTKIADFISLPTDRKQHRTLRKSSCERSGDSTGFLQIFCRTPVTPISPRISGKNSFDSPVSVRKCRQSTTHKWMAKQRVSTRLLRCIFGRSPTMNRMTGWVCYWWPSSSTTTRSPPLLSCLRSSKIYTYWMWNLNHETILFPPSGLGHFEGPIYLYYLDYR